MSKAPVRIERPAIELLLSILEAPQLEISAAALHTFPIDVRAQLLGAGFVKPSSFEPVATGDPLDGDTPLALSWSAQEQAFGHFDPRSGWVEVSHNDIRTYRIELDVMFPALLGTAPAQYASTVLLADMLWDIGSIRLSSSSKVAVLFGRRLFDPSSLFQVQRAILSRSPESQRIILTSTSADRMIGFQVGCAVISVHDVLGEGFVLNASSIRACLLEGRSSDHRELALSPDGSIATLYGQSFVFKKGVYQRAIVKYLYESYCSGQRLVPTAKILEDLELRGSARIRDYFKKNKAWKKLLNERDGLCGFCLRDDG
jgi:hypothetical protein